MSEPPLAHRRRALSPRATALPVVAGPGYSEGTIVDLNVNANSTAELAVVEVRGEVDVHSAPQLRDRLTQVIDEGHQLVIVDLSRLDFIDSTGLGALVAVRNHGSGTDTTLKLVCSSERLLKLFRITGLHEVFDIYDTVESASEPTAPAQS